jgi:hypothetical protein
MKTLASDFEDVFKLYLRLGQDLARILDIEDSDHSQALARSILENRDCLVRIEQMNSRILQLSSNWEKCRDSLDPASANAIQELARSTRAQAMHLKELCSRHAEKLQIARDRLSSEMAELSKAAQHLNSLKPVKNNYPKFFDSVY